MLCEAHITELHGSNSVGRRRASQEFGRHSSGRAAGTTFWVAMTPIPSVSSRLNEDRIGRLDSCWRRVVRQWEALQIELHGTYSVERLRTFSAFSQRTGVTRVAFWVVMTPIPCLLAASLPDLIPLAAPERGLAHSHTFWVREFISGCVIKYLLLEQTRHYLVELPLKSVQMLYITLMNGVCSSVCAIGLAHLIGYPVPFMGTLIAPVNCCIMGIGLYTLWRSRLKQTPSLRDNVKRYVIVLNVQMSFVVLYPVYSGAFDKLSGTPQTLFALLLPVMKLGAKNVLDRFIQDKEDAKAEFVNFNVEVFHALFVASCLQGSTSFSTTALIIAVDFVAACASIYDVHVILSSIQQCVADATQALSVLSGSTTDRQTSADATMASTIHYVDAALFLLQLDERLRSHSSIRTRSHALSNGQSACRKSSMFQASLQQHSPDGGTRGDPIAEVKPLDHTQPPGLASEGEPPTRPKLPLEQLPRGNVVRVSPLPSPLMSAGLLPKAPHDNQRQSWQLTEHDKRVLLSMSGTQRLELVQKVLKVMHITEFMLIVEFTEVIVPTIYSAFLVASYQLSNRAFYTPLRGVSAEQLSATVASVMLYSLLEVLSLAFACVMLQRKLRISALHQLAFVLSTQWQQVQAKLVFWVVISLELVLQHFGTDFTFQFTWLHKQSHQDGE